MCLNANHNRLMWIGLLKRTPTWRFWRRCNHRCRSGMRWGILRRGPKYRGRCGKRSRGRRLSELSILHSHGQPNYSCSLRFTIKCSPGWPTIDRIDQIDRLVHDRFGTIQLRTSETTRLCQPSECCDLEIFAVCGRGWFHDCVSPKRAAGRSRPADLLCNPASRLHRSERCSRPGDCLCGDFRFDPLHDFLFFVLRQCKKGVGDGIHGLSYSPPMIASDLIDLRSRFGPDSDDAITHCDFPLLITDIISTPSFGTCQHISTKNP